LKQCAIFSECIVSRYTFRPFVRADLDLAQGWLRSPEVVRWWGDPQEQEACIREDLDEPLMRQWIVSCGGRPFAYAQDYEAHSWPQAHLDLLPPGTRVIDAFIGDAEMLDRGHGKAFLRQLARMLLEDGAPLVAIDPVVANVRACRAYAGAGFTENVRVDTDAGPSILMTYPKGTP
jgi:aminoglycoside 6'-N-acetyltransferase